MFELAILVVSVWTIFAVVALLFSLPLVRSAKRADEDAIAQQRLLHADVVLHRGVPGLRAVKAARAA